MAPQTAQLLHPAQRRIPIRAWHAAAACAGLVGVGLFTWLGGFRHDDVSEYHRYALRFWTWAPLFRHLPTEYPPLAILPFSLTVLPPTHEYVFVFGCWMAVLFLAGFGAISALASPARALAYAVYLLVGAAGTLLGRFDLVPALATLAAIELARRHRYRPAYLLLAAGVLLKLYPGFLIPLVALHQWRHVAGAPMARGWSRGAARAVARAAAPGAGFLAAGFGLALVANAGGTLSPFTYAALRPLQLESVPASLLWLGTFAGDPAWPVKSFGSLNMVGPLDAVLKPLTAVSMVAGLAFVYWRMARGRIDLLRAAIAVVAVAIATGKVLSPQYLIWLLPLVAVESGLSIPWLAVAALTTAIYPFQYQRDGLLVPYAPDAFSTQMLALVAARNALLVVLTVRAVAAGRSFGVVQRRMRDEDQEPELVAG